MDIYSNLRARTRVLETLFISSGQEARRGVERKLVEEKNLGA